MLAMREESQSSTNTADHAATLTDKWNIMPIIYLDNAATSWPKPRCVSEAMLQCMAEFGANPGRSGHRMAMRADEMIYDCRTNLARLFHAADPLSIILTANATEAINLGIKGMLGPGDHVVISPLEHNAVVRPLKEMERRGIIELSVARGDRHGRVSAETITESMQPSTRLVIVAHASNVNGAIQPIDAIGSMLAAR
jgi:selenocysteine lyase/cysteine desulfurase